MERARSAAEKENQPLQRSGSVLRRQYSQQEPPIRRMSTSDGSNNVDVLNMNQRRIQTQNLQYSTEQQQIQQQQPQQYQQQQQMQHQQQQQKYQQPSQSHQIYQQQHQQFQGQGQQIGGVGGGVSVVVGGRHHQIDQQQIDHQHYPEDDPSYYQVRYLLIRYDLKALNIW